MTAKPRYRWNSWARAWVRTGPHVLDDGHPWVLGVRCPVDRAGQRTYTHDFGVVIA
jgi:hypothetical protein